MYDLTYKDLHPRREIWRDVVEIVLIAILTMVFVLTLI